MRTVLHAPRAVVPSSWKAMATSMDLADSKWRQSLYFELYPLTVIGVSTRTRDLALCFTTTTLIRTSATPTPRNSSDGTPLTSPPDGLLCKRLTSPGGEKFVYLIKGYARSNVQGKILGCTPSEALGEMRRGKRKSELADYLVLSPIGGLGHPTLPSSALCSEFISITARYILENILISANSYTVYHLCLYRYISSWKALFFCSSLIVCLSQTCALSLFSTSCTKFIQRVNGPE